jgi:ElaB/YqjD/DUF883 family membrane-anchored ribosome-binding protein
MTVREIWEHQVRAKGRGEVMEHAATTGTQGATAQTGLMDRVREGATTQLSRQKERATDGLGTVAQAVRQSTQPLRDQQHDTIAYYVEQAAQQLETLSTRLKEKDVSELVADAQRFARQRPALFIGSAFAVGLIGARFFKSSPGNGAPERQRRSVGYSDSDYRGAEVP